MEEHATQTANERIVNGVNVTRLFETIDAIKGDSAIARFQFRAGNKWLDGGHNHTTIKAFYGARQENQHEEPFELDEDEPPLLLGRDIGPNPVDVRLDTE